MRFRKRGVMAGQLGAMAVGLSLANTAWTMPAAAKVQSGAYPPATARAEVRSSHGLKFAQASQRTYDVAPQLLSDALVQFGRQTGLQVSVDARLVDGLRTPGVTNAASPEEALSALLRGTRLTPRFSGRSVVVAQATEVRSDADPNVLPTITVTGERENRSVFDTASSVDIVTSTDIQNSPIMSVNDIYNRVANVSPAFGGEGLVIRGIQAQGVGGGATASSSPLITTYIDNAPLPPFALRNGPKSIWDVEQVEILRGAQSTKQGRDSLGGAVFTKTRDPVFYTEMLGRVGYAAYNSRTASVAANSVVVPDLLALRVAADFVDTREGVQLQSDPGYRRSGSKIGSDHSRQAPFRSKHLRWINEHPQRQLLQEQIG